MKYSISKELVGTPCSGPREWNFLTKCQLGTMTYLSLNINEHKDRNQLGS
jgi:hypothetical protein